jgi:hypothetical protein
MVTKTKNPSRILPLFLCFFLGACSMYRGSPSGDRNSSPPRVPSPEKFEEADTNKDNVIDKEEAAAFTEKEKEKKIYPLWVISGILALSLLACLCTPAPAAYIKTKFTNAKDYIKDRFHKLSEYIKKKKKKGS